MSQKKVGSVFKFYVQPSVAAVEVEGKISIGDELHFQGATTDFKMKVTSMQIEGKEIETAKKGQKVGIKTPERVRPGDEVYKIAE
ncbi:MAG: U32 family peptidase C-terminal domain-containing protein [Candidatus Heimdallarchaeota archaeon]|nr:translation elongation factor-like protein [Candidatus Heimdallarchaeota archaeon]MCG3257279.1 U32 family peptidase C-terminal domain-containing protein [Candidatus Heimdallarchaeota archaeon]MCK4612336.1 U32 family peptidase C-terminal domain-containing protein [Candidatus Heimdallarchaeota archaeon]